jgi:acyl-CoA reductase-like NAD-dependent aldehyde dehydrogenase
MRIAGEKIGAERRGDRAIDVLNPNSGAVVGRVPKASVEEVRQAFAAAHAYRPKLSRFQRADILNRTAGLVRARTAEVAALISAESGLCMKDAIYEAGRVADVLVFGAGEALKDDGQIFS